MRDPRYANGLHACIARRLPVSGRITNVDTCLGHRIKDTAAFEQASARGLGLILGGGVSFKAASEEYAKSRQTFAASEGHGSMHPRLHGLSQHVR